MAKKKRYNLDETWTLCLSMHRWIAKEVKSKSSFDINDLKKRWLAKHWDGDVLICDCFFCDWVGLDEDGDANCSECPARKIDPAFDCCDVEYYYRRKPIAFYNKLVSLNRKRRKTKPKE